MARRRPDSPVPPEGRPGLAHFVNDNTDPEPTHDLEMSGEATKKLFDRIRNEGRTRTLIAASFWQTFLRSDAILRASGALGLEPLVERLSRYGMSWWVPEGEPIIVFRPELNRLDLLLLLPAFSGEPRTIRAFLTPGDVEQARRWLIGRSGIAPILSPEIALDLAKQHQPFSIVVASAPPMERLCIPNPSCQVQTSTGGSGSVGVVATDIYNRIGVTTALHVVGSDPNVIVNGVRGTVVASNHDTDSCFIEVDPPPVGKKPKNGIMKGILPRIRQDVWFEGAKSKHQKTRLTAQGVSPELPNISPGFPAQVYTELGVNPGDSGAALITDDGYIIGFAQARSGGMPSFSAWKWAHAVYYALQLADP
jgi:hypothetical protein